MLQHSHQIYNSSLSLYSTQKLESKKKIFMKIISFNIKNDDLCSTSLDPSWPACLMKCFIHPMKIYIKFNDKLIIRSFYFSYSVDERWSNIVDGSFTRIILGGHQSTSIDFQVMYTPRFVCALMKFKRWSCFKKKTQKCASSNVLNSWPFLSLTSFLSLSAPH